MFNFSFGIIDLKVVILTFYVLVYTSIFFKYRDYVQVFHLHILKTNPFEKSNRIHWKSHVEIILNKLTTV